MAHPHNTFKLGSVACDISTMHSYAGGGVPSGGLDEKWIPSAKIMCGNKPIIATECGYHNAVREGTSSQAVSEQASGKYLPRLFLEYFNRGIKRAYRHEFIDSKPNPKADNSTYHYGLLRSDGSPKPDFIAIKNLITLLKDSDGGTGSFPLKSLDYNLRGNTNRVHHTLLQKRNGNFYLILWQEVPGFNNKTRTNIVVTARQVTLTLNTLIGKAFTYQSMNSVTPTNQYKSPKTLRLSVPDHPLVIELVPARRA